MKRYLFFLLILCFLQNGFSQSVNYENYANQMIQKAQNLGSEIAKDLQRTSQFAMRSTNKDIYVLYLNGNKMACFSDEFSCKSQINSIKSRMKGLMENYISSLPRNVSRAEIQKSMTNYISNMNFSYRKERNPNYRESNLPDNGAYAPNPQFGENNGYNTPPPEEPRVSIFEPQTPKNTPQNTSNNDISIRTASQSAHNESGIRFANNEPQQESGIRLREQGIDRNATPRLFEPQQLQSLKNTMSEGECELKIKGKQMELDRLEMFCKHPQYLKCDSVRINELKQERENEFNKLEELLKERYTEELNNERKKLGEANENYRNCTDEFCRTAMQKEIDRLEQKIKDHEDIDKRVQTDIDREILKQIETSKSYAEEMCDVAMEMIATGNKSGGQALLDKYAPVVAAQSAYDFTKDNVNMMKDIVENFKDYYSNAEVYKALQEMGVYVVSTLGSTLIPISSPFWAVYSEAANQSINGEKINVKDAVKATGTNMAIDQAIDQIPSVGTIKTAGERANLIINFYSAVRDVYNEKKNQ